MGYPGSYTALLAKGIKQGDIVTEIEDMPITKWAKLIELTKKDAVIEYKSYNSKIQTKWV